MVLAVETPEKKELVSFIKRLRRLRNYDIAILVASLLGISLAVLLNIMGAHSIDELANTLLNFLTERQGLVEALFDFGILAMSVSALSYLGRCVDLMTQENTFFHSLVPAQLTATDKKLKKEFNDQFYRNYGSVLGVGIALAFSVALLVLLLLNGFNVAIFLTILTGTILFIGAISGLFSRLGQVADYYHINKTVNHNYELAILTSFVLSVIPCIMLGLSCTVCSPLSIFILVATMVVLISNLTSIGHYIGRSLDYFTDNRSLLFFKSQKPKIQLEKRYENIATAIGLGMGLVLGVTIVALGICMPAFLLALPVLLKTPLIVLLSMNMCTSIAARIGRILDRVYSIEETTEVMQELINIEDASATTSTLTLSQARMRS